MGILPSIAIARISEHRAEAIVHALPELIRLEQQYRDHPDALSVDRPWPSTLGRKTGAHIGKKVWQIDVYVLVDSGAETAHYTRWISFAVGAETGAVFVCEPDWNSKLMDAVVYVPLDE